MCSLNGVCVCVCLKTPASFNRRIKRPASILNLFSNLVLFLFPCLLAGLFLKQRQDYVSSNYVNGQDFFETFLSVKATLLNIQIANLR